jgi:crotonobetainyl-CoA:carnitine CoA-transferase CaiB-like acyl-CoA transferase
MTLGALEPKFWANFCRAVGVTIWPHTNLTPASGARACLIRFAQFFRSKSQSDWVDLLQDADCCCEPVLSLAEAFEHAQTVAGR